MHDASLLSGDLKLAGRLDARFFALLEAIEATGSINRAAATAGYSYRGAWLVLDSAANLATQPLVQRTVGGARGGGSRLTPTAQALLAAWRELQAAHREFLREREDWLLQQPALCGVLKRLSVRATARNQFAGTLTSVDIGPATAQATLRLHGGQEITATMTERAARELGVALGREAIAMINASSVTLVTDFGGYVLSARNQLAGTVSQIDSGQVVSLVYLTLPGGAVVTASVSNEAAQELAIGQAATAVFKAYAVMLALGPVPAAP